MKKLLALILLTCSLLQALDVYEIDGKLGIKVPDPQYELAVKGSIQSLDPASGGNEYLLMNAFRMRFVWNEGGQFRNCGIFRGFGDTNNRIEVRLWDEVSVGPVEKVTFEENMTKIFTDLYVQDKVGIGVENPLQELEVNGTAIASRFFAGLSGQVPPQYITDFKLLSLGKSFFQDRVYIGAPSLPSYVNSTSLLYVSGKTHLNDIVTIGQPGTNLTNEINGSLHITNNLDVSGNFHTDELVIGAGGQTEAPSNYEFVTLGDTYLSQSLSIGTNAIPRTDCMLAVGGTIRATEVIVKTQISWPDYVFNEDYELTSLEEVETFVKENKHLPGIPSAREIEESNLGLGEMQANLVKKVEELTLYMIDLMKENKNLKSRIEELENK